MQPVFLSRALSVGTLALLFSSSAWACSTCKCGDYTINLFGSEKPFEQRLRVGVDGLFRSETQGDPAQLSRSTDESRVLIGASYSVNDRLSLALQLPWVDKTIRDSDLSRQHAQGFGDLDVVARATLYRSGALSGRHLAGLRLGVRLPTSEQIKDAQGQRLDIDVQPDAGATVPNIGGWYGYFRYPWHLNATLTYFHFGDGHQGFAPGNSWVASTMAQYGLGVWALQLGVDARYAQKNRFSGVEDADSGGSLAMAFAGVALRATSELIISAGVQTPVLKRLNGYQHEDPVYRIGVTYDL